MSPEDEFSDYEEPNPGPEGSEVEEVDVGPTGITSEEHKASGAAPPVRFNKGNFMCPVCKVGPFEGPRALAKHEGRMHRMQQRLPNLSAPEPPPMPGDPFAPGGPQPFNPFSAPPSGMNGGEQPQYLPERPIDLSPFSELAGRVDTVLAEMGYNDKTWLAKRRIIARVLSRNPGYNYPQNLKTFLWSVGVRVDHLDIVTAEALGTDGTAGPYGGQSIPGMANPMMPYNPMMGPAPAAPQPQGGGSDFERFLTMLERMKNIGLVQMPGANGHAQQPQAPWADPNNYFQSLMTAFKSGKEATPAAPAQNGEWQEKVWDMQQNIIHSLIDRKPDGERAGFINELSSLGLLQRPQGPNEILDQLKKYKEVGLLGQTDNIEAMKVQKELQLEMKRIELEQAKMLHDLRETDQMKKEQREQFDSIKDLAGKALESIGKPLSEAIGQGMKDQIRMSAQAPPPPMDPAAKLAQLRDAKAKIEAMEKAIVSEQPQPAPPTAVI